jgi:hypothetical protein
MSMRDDRSDLTDELVIETGGWSARYARVALVVVDGDIAVVLVDGNGDGAELELEAWHRGEGGWEGDASSGSPGGGTLGSTWSGGAQWCMAGRSVPGEVTVVRFKNEDYRCEANHLGFWGFVRQTDDLVRDERPTIITQGTDKAE